MLSKIISEIKNELEKQGISQSAIARRIGEEQKNVNNLLAGRTKRINAELVEKLRGALGMAADPQTAYGVAAIHQSMTPAEAQLLEILRQAPDTIEMIEAYIKLPSRKQKIMTGKILEALDEAEREREGK